MLSIRIKGIEKVYDYYFKKYNGVFPNNRVHKHKTENYNIPKPIIAYREGMTIILEGKSIREISKLTECHHSRVEKLVNTKLPYRSWFFEYLLQ